MSRISAIWGVFISLWILAVQPTVEASQLLLGAGSHARSHPLDLRTLNVIWQQNFSASPRASGWQTDWELALGQLRTNEGDTLWGGAGLGVNYALTPHARFRLGGRISYLDRYRFIYRDDEAVYRLRSYGGHRQFSVSASLLWHLEPQRGPGVGYRFEHMSNAFLYDSNPGIDTHNLILFIPLGNGD